MSEVSKRNIKTWLGKDVAVASISGDLLRVVDGATPATVAVVGALSALNLSITDLATVSGLTASATVAGADVTASAGITALHATVTNLATVSGMIATAGIWSLSLNVTNLATVSGLAISEAATASGAGFVDVITNAPNGGSVTCTEWLPIVVGGNTRYIPLYS